MTKAKKVWLAVGVLFLGIVFIVGGYTWSNYRFERVALGIASPRFPWSDFSIEELENIYPGHDGPVDVATTQTPEETYNKLISALLNNNVEESLSLFYVRNKEAYSKLFSDAKSQGSLSDLVKNLELNIERTDYCYDTVCKYIMKESKKPINFVKNYQGVWLIESL